VTPCYDFVQLFELDPDGSWLPNPYPTNVLKGGGFGFPKL
jgi:hypothetical protein